MGAGPGGAADLAVIVVGAAAMDDLEQLVNEHAALFISSTPILIVRTMADLPEPHAVGEDLLRAKAKGLGAGAISVSAKTGHNILAALRRGLQMVLEAQLPATWIVKEGGNWPRLWQVRWLALSTTHLAYSKSEEDIDSPLKSIALHDVLSATSEEANMLHVHVAGRTFKFRFKAGEERDAWLRILTKLLRSRAQIPLLPPPKALPP